MPAHRDSVDGPVVTGAPEALASDDIDKILPFAGCSHHLFEARRRRSVTATGRTGSGFTTALTEPKD
jgi:hypothetical protein